MIKLVLFDLGKVLIDFDFKIAVANLRKHCRVDLFKVQALFYKSSFAKDWDRGLLSPEQFYGTVKEKLNLPLEMEEFMPIWNGIFSENTEMVQFARGIGKKKKVAILSNTNPWHAEHIRSHHPWVHDFDHFIASCDVHLLKPDPEIFTLALKRSGAVPGETLYIDDISENVRQARKMGIDAFVFRSYSQMIVEMKRRKLP